MARFVLLTFLVLCMVYMIQANPRPDHETVTQDPIAQGAAAIENLAAKAKKTLEDAANNPDFQNIVASGKKLVEEGIENIRKTLEDLLPKTPSGAPTA